MRRWVVGVAAALGLGGCTTSLPEPAQIPLAAPTALPMKAQVLLHVSQGDLERAFSYKLNSVSRQETDIHDGQIMAQAAHDMLAHAFAGVAVNQPYPLPDLVVTVSGTALFDRTSGSFRVTCALDANRADGMPVAHGYNVYSSPTALGFETSMRRFYGQCLKGPIEELLRSPALARLAAAGLPAADQAAAEGYLRIQGFPILH